MEIGFFHPSIGYWQALSMPDQNVLRAYPAGTVRVPLKPGSGFEWSGLEWVDKRTPAILWGPARAERDRRLAQSDWTQLPDSPLNPEVKHQWAVYRQALRNITLQADPANIVWPTPPG